MTIRCLIQFLNYAVLTAVLAGCAADLQPHVYIPKEFDRTRPDFNKPPKDRGEVIICFNKFKTTPQKVSNLAVLECARHKKKAVYVKQEARFCPLATPIAARYNCVADGNTQK